MFFKEVVAIKSFNLFFTLFVIVVVVLSFLMILPFWKVLFSAAIITYLLHPLYKRLDAKIKHPNLSASLMLLFSLLVVVVPSFLILNGLVSELVHFYSTMNSSMSVPVLSSKINSSFSFFGLSVSLASLSSQIISEVESFILSRTSHWVLSVPNFLLNSFVFFFALFFFFRDGEKFVNSLKKVLEINIKHKHFLEKEISSMTWSILYGSFMAALAQAIFATVGFYLFRVPDPLLWGVATFFVSLLPFIGPPLIWFPLAVIKLLQGYYMGSHLFLFQGIALLIYGAFIVGSVDNIVKAKVVSTSSNLNPLLVLVSILGGLYLFGFVGVLAGPLVMVLLLSLIKLYSKYGVSLFVKG